MTNSVNQLSTGNFLSIGPVASMSSSAIAGLAKKRHDNTKRTIESLAGQGVISWPQVEDGEKAANGVVEKLYVFYGEQGRRDSIVVMAQLSPELTGRLVDRWQELETKLAAPAVQAPQTYLEALKALVVSEESKLALEAQTRALLQQIETEQPYVELAHALTGATTMTRRDWLAMMKDEHETDLKEKALTQWLEDQGYCYRDQASRQLRAYAHYSNLFKLEYELINGGYRPLLKVTGQGVLELTPKVVAHFAGESK